LSSAGGGQTSIESGIEIERMEVEMKMDEEGALGEVEWAPFRVSPHVWWAGDDHLVLRKMGREAYQEGS
jgi:hypothetical protein